MKVFKRLILIALCAVVVACSFSGCAGCSDIFGSLGCTHDDGLVQCADEKYHFSRCELCGREFHKEKHETNLEKRDNDNEYHYIVCIWCKHVCEKIPHTFTDWHGSVNVSNRKCTVCNFQDECKHEDAVYVITDDYHSSACNYCGFDSVTHKEEHVYDQYTSVTETTHTLCCKCGKISGDAVSHVLSYSQADDEHWLGCKCGYETGREACTFGDYVKTDNGHYRACSVCLTQTQMTQHSYTLTEFRERVCGKCGFIEDSYSILIGTWKYEVGQERHLILRHDWSYTIETRGGTEISSGDYFVANYSVDAYRNVSGYVYLSKDGYVDFKFTFGENNKFKSGTRTYTKI